jgi:cobalt-zinc-cadmium efflux system protein
MHAHPPGEAPHAHPHAHPTRAFAWATSINFGYSLLEALAGLYSGSLALLSDALHNFGDSLGLALAWGAAALAQRHPTDRHTYGWRRATLLSPLANAIVLVGFSGALMGEAIRRFSTLPEVPGALVVAVAALGMLVNLGTAALFHRGQGEDLNRRGAYLHLLSDAGISFAAVLAGLGMWYLGWSWLDPVSALLVGLVIIAGSAGLLRESLRQVMDAVPSQIDAGEVRRFLEQCPGVVQVHHLHIWSIGAAEIALTAHLVRDRSGDHDRFIDDCSRELDERFRINHATLQIEFGSDCRHDRDDRAPHH